MTTEPPANGRGQGPPGWRRPPESVRPPWGGRQIPLARARESQGSGRWHSPASSVRGRPRGGEDARQDHLRTNLRRRLRPARGADLPDGGLLVHPRAGAVACRRRPAHRPLQGQPGGAVLHARDPQPAAGLDGDRRRVLLGGHPVRPDADGLPQPRAGAGHAGPLRIGKPRESSEVVMNHLHSSEVPPVGLGMLSLVLGSIALLLFFLPILGLPIGAFGLIFGVAGVIAASFTAVTNLRWSLMGSAVCAVALAVNLAITCAPEGYLAPPKPPRMWQSVPDRPYVPPPASPTGEVLGASGRLEASRRRQAGGSPGSGTGQISTRTLCPSRKRGCPGSRTMTHSSVRTSFICAGSCSTARRWLYQPDSRSTLPRQETLASASSCTTAGIPSLILRSNSCSTVARMTCGPSAANSTAGCPAWPPSTSPGPTGSRSTVPARGALTLHSSRATRACCRRAFAAASSFSARWTSACTSWCSRSASRWASARPSASSSCTCSSAADTSTASMSFDWASFCFRPRARRAAASRRRMASTAACCWATRPLWFSGCFFARRSCSSARSTAAFASSS